ncbi:MAG: virulence protein E [Prevotellaceae bacterium]|jgi:hypothetical protein|nr:virulence protein E [Prevotellaceae bacterium]
MTPQDAILELKRRNEKYAQRHGINDYVLTSESIINAFIACIQEETAPANSDEGKTPFPFAETFFSCYHAPIGNIIPAVEYDIPLLHSLIVSEAYREVTAKLRKITDKENARKFKAANFDYVTFSGTFSKRDAKCLLKHSGLIVIDFDHIGDFAAINSLKARLLKDKYFDTLLMFRSPSGDGLKWVINIDITRYSHRAWFEGIYYYILNTYGLTIDNSGSDIARACFICHDPQAYINPNFYKLKHV